MFVKFVSKADRQNAKNDLLWPSGSSFPPLQKNNRDLEEESKQSQHDGINRPLHGALSAFVVPRFSATI